MRRLFFLKVEVGNWKILSTLKIFRLPIYVVNQNIINSCQMLFYVVRWKKKLYNYSRFI